MSGPGVKICGLCRPEDARSAARSGADYAGVILAPGGRRSQTPESALRVLEAAGDGTARVGVFVDGPEDEVAGLARSLALDVVQLHGAETPELAARLRGAGAWRVWKAVRPRTAEEFLAAVEAFAGRVDGLVVDGWSGAAAGGTGARFPWEAVAAVRDRVPAGTTLVVAGGLEPENVARAVELLRPDVVDVSSGVERTTGEKDAARIEAFVAAARRT